MSVFKTFLPLSLLTIFLASAAIGATYYSQGNLPPNLTTSWNINPGGGGLQPGNFTSADLFIVQLGHTMTTTAAWNLTHAASEVRTTGGTLIFAHSSIIWRLTVSDGIVTVNTGITLTVNNGNTTGTFEDILVGSLGNKGELYNLGKIKYGTSAAGKVSSTGTYVHQIAGDTIPQFTWDPSSTLKITGITTTLPIGLGQGFGNIIYDCPSQTANVTMNTTPATLANFTINSTGTGSLLLGNNIAPTTSLKIKGGIFDLSTFTANGFSLADSIIVDAGAKLRIGGTNSFPINYNKYKLDGTSTVEYYGTAAQTIAAKKYGNLFITGTRNANITLANTDTIHIAGTFNVAATFTGGSFITTNSKLDFNGSSIQTIHALPGSAPYHTIVVKKPSAETLQVNSNITLKGNLALLDGIFYDNGSVVTVYGNIDGSFGQHISGGGEPGGRILLTGDSLQHQIKDVDLGTVYLDDVYGATIIAAPGIKQLDLVSGTLDITNGLYILAGGSLTNSGGFITNTGFVNFNESSSVNGSFTFYDVWLQGTVFFNDTGSVIEHMLRIDSAGTFFGNAPTYSSGASLMYNSGGMYNRESEWSATSGAGYPYHVKVSNNTLLNLGANGGASIEHKLAGTLSVDSNATISMNVSGYEKTSPLTVNGDVVNNGTIVLSSSPGGYLDVKGNFEQNGTLVSNLSAVRFSGTTSQTILKNGGGIIGFDTLIIASTDSVVLRNANANDLSINKVLLIESGIFYPDTARIDFANNATLVNTGGTFVPANGTVNFNDSGSISGTVDIWNLHANGPLDPGTGTTIKNALVINSGGSIINNSPTYDVSSTLFYNTGGNFNRNMEWNSISGAGYPNNVTIQNNTTLKLGSNLGLNTARTIAGNLTINIGSTLTMNAGESAMTAALTISGDIINNGDISLSFEYGGELSVGGNWSGTGTFNANGRNVTFNGTSQSLSGDMMFSNFTVDNGTVLSLNNSFIINDTLNLSNGFINTGADTLFISSTGSVSQFTGHVIGNLNKYFPIGTGVTNTFEIGDENNYSPVDITFGNVTIDGTLTASTSTTGVNLSGSDIDTNKNVNRYWTLRDSLIDYDSYDVTFNYNETDVDGLANTNNFIIKRDNDTVWNTVSVGTMNSTSTQGTGIHGFGTFAIGEMIDITPPTAPQNLAVFDSVASYFTITWNMNLENDVAKYYIYRDTLPNPTVIVDSTMSSVDTTRAFFDMTIGKPYYFRVAAVDTSSNVSSLSNEVTAVPYMTYAVAASVVGNGTISPDSVTYVNHGDSIVFTMTAAPHHHIDSIVIDQSYMITFRTNSANTVGQPKPAPDKITSAPVTVYGTGNGDTLRTYTFPNVTSGHNITAYYSIDTFSIANAVVGNGSLIPSGNTLANFGDTLSFSISPDTYHHLDSLVVDGIKVDSTLSYTFENVTSPHTIDAYFSPNVFHHFIVRNGDYMPIDPQTAGQNFSIIIAAVDSLGNPVDSFTGNVWFSSTDSTMGVLGGNLSNPFIAGQHGPQTVSLYKAGSQTISVIDSVSGKTGISDSFIVNPAGLSHFVVADTCGCAISDQVQSFPFPIKIIASDTYGNIQNDYTGTVDVSVSGATLTQGSGTTPNFINGILANHVMEISSIGLFSIYVDDVALSRSGASNSFTVVSNTNSIFSTSINGIISPFGTTVVNYGDSAVFSFAPNPGYHFDSLYVDGSRMFDSTMQYTFFNVTASHTIDVYNSVNLNTPPMFTSVLSDTAIARFDTLYFQYYVFDPDSGTLSYSLFNSPSGATIDSTGQLRYIPAANANGFRSIIVQVSDDSLAIDTDTVNVRVNIYGDVSGNGTISALDASLVLRHAVNLDTLKPLQLRVADVSGINGVSALDASYLLQYSVGLIPSFPGGLGKQQQAAAVLSAFSFRIQKSIEAGEYDLFISVNKPSNVFGIAMDLGFDSTIVVPKIFEKTVVSDSMAMASRFFTEQVKLAMAGTVPLNKAGDVMKFTFKLKDPNYPKNAVLFTMKKFVLNETDHTSEIGGITLNVRDLAQLPTVYKLEQNFPNPFNPATTINYQLPDASTVTIIIYNMLGQEIKTLINEQQLAGYYSMQWNGTDNADRKISSGVYIYRIEATGYHNARFTEVKKMVMIK